MNLQQYIQQEKLFDTDKDCILLAVSGGLDSVVMLDMCYKIGLKIGVAHCNFKLRGEAADGDALFVQNLATAYQVPFYHIAFDTTEIAKNRGQSIQIAARELRYEWLENIRAKHKFDYIATAHHANDNIETVLYNLTKGTGISGLHGILPKKNRIIRPVLFLKRIEIEQYAAQHQLKHREDASNASDKYTRNFVRHQIVPRLKTINSALEATFAENILRFRETEQLYLYAIAQLKKEIITEKDDVHYFSKTKLLESIAPKSVLFECLKPYGFNNHQVQQILNSIDGISGKQFYSKTHVLLIERTELVLQQNSTADFSPILIQKNTTTVPLKDGKLQFSIHPATTIRFERNPNIAYFDIEKLIFPLTIRTWNIGDIFQPFGMKGQHKKVSDVFSNAKLSLFEKENTLILESNSEICWIIGLKNSEFARVTTTSQQVLKIEKTRF